ncbi:MAG: class I adenylate-forming enzyme family protein [Alphaproteobacteria bacterium]
MPEIATRLTPDLIKRFTDEGYWGSDTIHDIVARQAKKFPDREVLVDHRERITYGELYDRIESVAAALSHNGVRKGDVVTIQLPNWIEFVSAFFAVERLGAIAIQINPDFRSREVDFILRFSESAAYICPENFHKFDYPAMIADLRGDLPDLRVVFVVDGAGSDDVVPLRDAMKGIRPDGPFAPVEMAADDVYRMAFTSGTTGNPKGVIHSFNTTVSTCRMHNAFCELDSDEVVIMFLPLGLNWGYLCLVQTILAGARMVLLDQFSPSTALETIENEKITFLPAAPAVLVALLNEPTLKDRDLTSLRMTITGGASCAIETIREFREKFKSPLIEIYGMLETGIHTSTTFTDDPEEVTGSVGKILEGMGLRILDKDGNDVPDGTEGEIAAFGPAVHLGYHKNPKANAECFIEDGWFRTGDLAFIDPRGNVRISGRSKEIVNRGGKKFHPREVEEILYTNENVMHAAILGVPDARLGERNCLCVIPRPGKQVSLEDMIAMLKGQVANYKLPEELEIFDEFPFTPTGKLQRHRLMELVAERHKS